MNLTTVLTAAADMPALPDSAGNVYGDGDQVVDFGKILAAIPVDDPAQQPAVCVMPTAKVPASVSLDATLPEPANAVPPGNSLPQDLPPIDARPATAIPIQRRSLSPRHALTEPDGTVASDTQEAPLAESAQPLLLVGAPLLPPVVAATVPVAACATPAAAPSQPDTQHQHQPRLRTPEATGIAFPSLPRDARPLQANADPAQDTPLVPQSAASTAPPPAPLRVQGEARSPVLATPRALPVAALRELVFDKVREVEAPASAQVSLPLATASNPAQPAFAAAPAVKATPHDFAALVDRLCAARDALQPQAVSIAVSHGDFGPVRLHFRHEDGALKVTMASGDPDFARAVAAAPPVQPSAPAADAGSAQQRGNEARSFDGGAHQSRGHAQPDRREGRAASADPSPSGKARRDETAKPGIFA